MTVKTKRKKRILVVITTSFVSYGGLTTVAMNYYRNINKSYFEIDFASTNECPKILYDELYLSGSKYYRLPGRIKSFVLYMLALQSICRNYKDLAQF